MKEEIILTFMKCLNQFKILHWETMGDAKHRALGELYDEFNEFMDEFVEIMMGKYGRPKFSPDFSLPLKDLSAIGIEQYVDEVISYMIGLSDKLDPRTDSDLLNKRDEILGTLNKTKYLLTLKF